eukprot:jgi/Ulvmu1/7161/UM034_0069.1
MDGVALDSLQESAYQPSARAASTTETRQQLLQLLPFISEKLDAQTSNPSSNGLSGEQRSLDAPDPGGTLKEQPRVVASSWSMTSNTLKGHHDVNNISMPGQCMVLSSESNSLLAPATVPPIQQRNRNSLDLSTIGHQHHAHASAPTNSAVHSQPRPASISALQHYINGSSITGPINDMQHLPPRTETPLGYTVHVSNASLDPSPSRLLHAAPDIPTSRVPPHHFVGPPSISSMSCPSNAQPLPESVGHSLHRLHLQSSPAPAHQFLPPPSSCASASMPQPVSAAHRWPPYPERFPHGTLPPVHPYHQSAPEHAASAYAPSANKLVDAHLQAYVSHPPAVSVALPLPADVPGLSSAASSAEMHLARLTVKSLPDPAGPVAPLNWQQYPVPVSAPASALPPQSMLPHKPPDWCVVTGLMLAPGHVRPPDQGGAGSVTTMLVWPPGIRSALASGQLCLTLDPTEVECRGSTCLPSLMFCCPASDERAAMTTVKGVYRRDMFHGRADLAEQWRTPHAWETDTGEVTLQEMSGMRLVLSRHGFSLLPSAVSATFLCMQSLIMVLGSPDIASRSASLNRLAYGDPAFSSIEDTPGCHLLWEVARSATSVGAHLQTLPRDGRGSNSRKAPMADTSRGGWLQRLNHEKQKQDLTVEWHDRQLSDLTWISTLLVNGGPVNSSDPCVKKQDARDGAAQAYLSTRGVCE